VLVLRACAAGPFKAQDGVPYNSIWSRACMKLNLHVKKKKLITLRIFFASKYADSYSDTYIRHKDWDCLTASGPCFLQL
jgi:hypothetical protein